MIEKISVNQLSAVEDTKPDSIRLGITFANKAQLYQAYLYYLQNGGLFVPMEQEFDLQQHIELEVHLPDTEKTYNISGQVVLLIPCAAKLRWTPGVGIEFEYSENSRRLRDTIHSLIGDTTGASRGTRIV